MANKLVNSAGRPLMVGDVTSQVGAGWRFIIEDLIKDLFFIGWDGEITQVKEKFGSLRFYVGGASHKVLERIDQAELLSSTICEKCGDAGKTSDWGKGWWLTLCEKHGKERQELK